MVGIRGEASTDWPAVAGVERGAIAGDGGGGIELTPGVFRAGGGFGVITGVDVALENAFGFWRYSRNFRGLIFSFTTSVVGSETLSSRDSYVGNRLAEVLVS